MRRLVEPDRAAAVLTQIALRRRATGKFGERAGSLFLTPDGLEQATRASTAARRAARFAVQCRAVADLGCGVGADALALLDAGSGVVAVESDLATALLADANLDTVAGVHQVVAGDAVVEWARIRPETDGVFCDPARRTASGRTWRVEDLSPPWDFALSLLEPTRLTCLKLGPGIDRGLLPREAEVEWVSDAGTVVECAVWSGPGTDPGRRTAVVDGAELRATGADPVAVTGPGTYLWEPDGAVIRARAVDDLARVLGATRLADDIAYLTGTSMVETPFARAFEVRDVLPWDEKVLRAWVRDQGVGTLDIKKRGIDVDPAALRRRLKPRGSGAATLILSPTPSGAVALVCDRVRNGGG